MTSDNEIERAGAIGRAHRQAGVRPRPAGPHLAGDLDKVTALALAPECGHPAVVRSCCSPTIPPRPSPTSPSCSTGTRRIYLCSPTPRFRRAGCGIRTWSRSCGGCAMPTPTPTTRRSAPGSAWPTGTSATVPASPSACWPRSGRASWPCTATGRPLSPAPLADAAPGLATAWATAHSRPRPGPDRPPTRSRRPLHPPDNYRRT